MTEDEADAHLMRECGLTLDEISRLNLYWRRLLLGYVPKPPEEDPEVLRARIQEQIMRTAARGRNVGGWATP